MFLGTAGVAVLLPVTPQLIDAEGSPFLYGLTQSCVNLMALVGNAVLGWHSDLHGRRAAWLVFAASICLGTVALLLDVMPLNRLGLILRMNPGVTITLGAATVADFVASSMRARANSRMDAFFAAGFAAGAPLGGRLSRYGRWSNVVAALFAGLLQIAVVARCLPRRDTVTASAAEPAPAAAAEAGDPPACDAKNPGRALLRLWLDGGEPIRVLLVARFCVGLARMLVISTFQLFTQRRFGTTPEEFGYFLALVGVSFVVMSAFVVPQILRFPGVSQQRFFLLGCVVMCVARLGIAAAPTLALVLAADLLVALGSGLVSSSGKSMLSDLVPPSRRGLVLGAGGSVETAAGVIAPAIAGWLFQKIGDFAPAAFAALVCAAAALVVGFASALPTAAADAGSEKKKR